MNVRNASEEEVSHIKAVEDEIDEQRDLRGNDEQRDLEKLYNALEENGLVMRTNMDGTQISPILLDLLKKLTDIRNDMDGNTLPAEIDIPFPVVWTNICFRLMHFGT